MRGRLFLLYTTNVDMIDGGQRSLEFNGGGNIDI